MISADFCDKHTPLNTGRGVLIQYEVLDDLPLLSLRYLPQVYSITIVRFRSFYNHATLKTPCPKVLANMRSGHDSTAVSLATQLVHPCALSTSLSRT